MLGTHNSFTYLKPRKWWMRLIDWTARCQSLNVEEQIEHGAECIDARIRLSDDGDGWIFAHGPIEYENDLAIDGFSGIDATDVIYRHMRNDRLKAVRLIHERAAADDEQDASFAAVASALKAWGAPYGVEVICCRRKGGWEPLCTWAKEPATDQSAVGSMQSDYGKVWPWLWRVFNRRKYAEAVNRGCTTDDDSITLVDFLR